MAKFKHTCATSRPPLPSGSRKRANQTRIEPLENRLLFSVAYTITDLGVPGGATDSFADGINGTGVVVGTQKNGSTQLQGLFYQSGLSTTLPTFFNGSDTQPRRVNDNSIIVGRTNIGGNILHAFADHSGIMVDLGVLSGDQQSFANDINSAGQVVGGSYVSVAGNSRAFLYNNGQLTSLGALPGVAISDATGINSNGLAVGSSATVGGQTHAVLFANSSVTDLGVLSGDANSSAADINDNNQIVGVSSPASGATTHAFVYANGVMSSLGALSGDNSSAAEAINGAGQIVGYSANGATQHAFVYSSGVMSDLTTLIAPSSGWSLQQATDINSSGQICGFGVRNGAVHAFVLSPVDLADLTGAAATSLPASASAGQSIPDSFTINNAGPGIASGTFSVNFLLETSPGIASDGVQIGSFTGSIQAGPGVTSTPYTASFTIPGNAALGTHYVFAQIVGGAGINDNHPNDKAFLLGSVSIVVGQPRRASAISLNESTAQSIVGNPVTFTVAVAAQSSAPGSASPTGTVHFYENGAEFGNTLLNSVGNATFTLSTLPAGALNITATYDGDINYTAATSASLSQLVASPQVGPHNLASSISLAESTAQSSIGNLVTFTATVIPQIPGTAIPTGTVHFYENGQAAGDTLLNDAGVAIFATPALPRGALNISATYDGDGTYAPSVSNSVSQIVNSGSVQPTMTRTILPTSVIAGTTHLGISFVRLANTLASLQRSALTVQVFASPDQATDPSAILIGTLKFPATLRAKGALVLPVRITTTSLPSGTYHLITQTTDANGNSNFSVNPAALTVIPAHIALTPSILRLILPASLVAGARVRGVELLRISNTGNVASTGFSLIQLYASADGITNSGTYFSQSRRLIVPAGRAAVLALPITTVPAGLQGNFQTTTALTTPNAITTTAVSASTVAIAPPFVAVSAKLNSVLPATIKVGRPAVMSILITNQGNISAIGIATLELALVANGQSVSIPLTLLNPRSPRLVILPGRSVLLRIPFRATPPAGQYFPTISIALGSNITTATGTSLITLI